MLNHIIRNTVNYKNYKYFASKVDISDTRDLFMKMSNISKLGIEIKGLSPIVVHGAQSSGKTSVIEAISGFNLFPKRNDLATLKPMDITTIQSDKTMYKVGNDVFYSENDASEQISRMNNNSSINKISVVIQSPNVYNTFFKDLPGLCFLTHNGDKSFPEKVKNMHIHALEDHNNIPVIINPGPTDPATNLALQLTHQYNRNKDALGIITKTDLTENQKTTMIKDMLNGKKYQLGYGYIATVLRNGKDIDNNISINDKMEEERLFFENHPEIRPSGVEEIRKKMSSIQFERIRNNIPDILANIDIKVDELKESKTILDKIIEDPNKRLPERLATMLKKLVSSSPYRANLEMKMEKEFIKAITSFVSYDTIIGEQGIHSSDEPINNGFIKNVHDIDNNKIAFSDLFNHGAVSPIPVHNNSLQDAFITDQNIGNILSGIRFYYNDESIIIDRLEWHEFINKYFTNIENNADIENLIYDITERMLLEYIYEDKDINDDITKKFSEYIIKMIGSSAYEETLRFAIYTCVSSERRPSVDTVNLCKNIIKNNPEYFKFSTGFIKNFWGKKPTKVLIKIFGHEFNKAYIENAMTNIAKKCSSIVKVHLMDRMVPKAIEMLMDISNKENAMKEKSKINDKISTLKDFSVILEQYK